MAIHVAQTPRLLINFLYIIYISQLITSFSPADHYLINCGSTSPTILDADHRQFTGDSSESGSHFLSGQTFSVSDSNPDPNLSPIYHTSRVFTRHSKYVFGVKERGSFMIRLHFGVLNLTNFDGVSVKFHVLVNGYVVLYDFSGENVKNFEVKDYVIWVNDDKVVVSFVPAKKSSVGFVSGIELISAPKYLIGDVGRLVNSEGIEEVNGLMKNGFQNVHRVNVDSLGVITLGVGPSNMSMPHAVDGILNGVEIMKINNAAGSLDGLVSAESIMKCRSHRDIGVWASLVAAMILLLVAPVVVHHCFFGLVILIC